MCMMHVCCLCLCPCVWGRPLVFGASDHLHIVPSVLLMAVSSLQVYQSCQVLGMQPSSGCASSGTVGYDCAIVTTETAANAVR